MSVTDHHRATVSYQSRREFMRFSAAASAVGVSGWLPRLAWAAGDKKPPKACILLWMAGGPSQLETLDPKPGHNNGGPTKAIATSVPGVSISENLPGIAKQMSDLAIVRSMNTREGDHGRATQLMMTGYRPMGGVVEYPMLGSLVAHRLQPGDTKLPGFVSVAPVRFANLGSGFLGPKYSPLIVSGDSNDPNARANLTVENLDAVGVSGDGLKRRQELLSLVRSGMTTSTRATDKHAAVYDSAMRMVETRGEGAFRLDEEPAELRDAYGRNRFGQGCLLARRLVQRGVSFVEVSLNAAGNANWDSHVDNATAVRTMCETLDPAWSTLLNDLRRQGMLESTLVVWMGEFGRTPKINGSRGRDHFPDAWSMALAGGGASTGGVYGATSDDGMEVTDRPVAAADLYATVLKILGIDPYSENQMGDRPIPLIDEHGTVIKELVG